MGNPWVQFLWSVVGLVLLQIGAVGLITGGEFPRVTLPTAVKPVAKFLMTLFLITGVTLVVGMGTPDLVERLFLSLR